MARNSATLAPLPATLALQLTGINKAFGPAGSRTVALEQADFDARLGELMMLVGPSGSGKTTLLSILTGTLHSDTGESNVLGYRLGLMSQAELTSFRREHIGFIFQDFNLIATLSVWENVAVPLLIQGYRRREAEARARAILAQVGLQGREDEPPKRLSGGQQQRIAIARALVHAPTLIVCDEPTSALDSRTGHQVMELLTAFARDPRRTVIVVTHDPRIYHYADRMAEMEDGRITRVLANPAAIAAAHPPN